MRLWRGDVLWVHHIIPVMQLFSSPQQLTVAQLFQCVQVYFLSILIRITYCVVFNR
jgi:hypothetical protein